MSARWSIRRSTGTAVLGVLLLAACGGGEDTPEATGSTDDSAVGSSTSAGTVPLQGISDVEVVDDIAASVPEDIRSRGTLIVATEGTYPPFELFAEDNTTLIGVDPDLASAVSRVMDLEVELVNTKFDSIIPGLQAGRFDAGWASFSATAERQEVVDFVTYFQGGSTILYPTGNPNDLSIDDLCGARLAVQKGTIYESDTVPELNRACLDAGQPEIEVAVFPAAPETILAVSSGRADATISDLAPLAYAAQQSDGQFEVQDQQLDVVPWGVVLPKGSALAEPLLAAIEHLMQTGTYTEILEKWDVQGGAITDPVINPLTTPAG